MRAFLIQGVGSGRNASAATRTAVLEDFQTLFYEAYSGMSVLYPTCCVPWTMSRGSLVDEVNLMQILDHKAGTIQDTPGGPLFDAHGIHRIQTLFVNCYMVSNHDGSWVLVDSGLPGFKPLIKHHARTQFGVRPPEAIILTHGHFDHAGSALELAGEWNVPIYCHRLETPYLDGRSDYPPKDPSMGGAIAFLSRAFPHTGYDFSGQLQELPGDGTVPGLPEWKWLHTPGHTAGHISLFRLGDRALITGDAVTSMDLDSWTTQMTHQRKLSRPPAPLTTDWDAARQSIAELADLHPQLLFAGHGAPLYGERVGEELARLAQRLEVPKQGRYGQEPVIADEQGIVSVPPPVPDPVPLRMIATAAFGFGVYAALRYRSRRQQAEIHRFDQRVLSRLPGAAEAQLRDLETQRAF